MQDHQEQEQLSDQKCILTKLLIQPVIRFDIDIGLSALGKLITPDSSEFESCEYFIFRDRGLKIVSVCWKTRTAIVKMVSKVHGFDLELKVSFELLSSLPC